MCFSHVAMWPCTVQVKVNICTSIMPSPPRSATCWYFYNGWLWITLSLLALYITFSSDHASVKDVSGYFYFYCVVPSFSMGFLINIFLVLTPLCAFCVYYLLIYVYTYSVYSVYTIIMCIERLHKIKRCIITHLIHITIMYNTIE